MPRRCDHSSVLRSAFPAVLFLCFLASAASAELVEPTLPERHEVKRPPKVKPLPLTMLANPDLPKRKGVEASILTVHAAGRVAEQFDSNVFLADSGNRADIISILSPSVGFEMKARDTVVSGDYEIEQYLFGVWDSQNHLDHRVRALGESEFGDYKLTVKDEFRIFIDRAAEENSLRLKENTNYFKAGVASDLNRSNRVNFDVGYTNKIQSYDSEDLDRGQLTYKQRSYYDQAAYATVSYRFRPKTYAILENDIGYITYYETSQFPDSWYVDSLAGIRGEWTNKLTVNLRAGFRCQEYQHSDVVSDKPYIGPIVRGGFQYAPTKDDKVVVTLERTDYESTYAVNNHYTANVAGVDYRHKYTEKVSCGLFGVYQLHMYPCETTENGTTAKRYDNFLEGGVSARYDMNRWMSTEVKYQYRQKMSIFDVYDYKDNLFTVRLTAGF